MKSVIEFIEEKQGPLDNDAILWWAGWEDSYQYDEVYDGWASIIGNEPKWSLYAGYAVDYIDYVKRFSVQTVAHFADNVPGWDHIGSDGMEGHCR